MKKSFAGHITDFDGGSRRIIHVDGNEVVVFRHQDEYYALSNWCLHMGGPVGEGHLTQKVEGVVSPDGSYTCDAYSDDEVLIVCPWHGWEYNIRTGCAVADPSQALATYKTKIEGNDVYVIQ